MLLEADANFWIYLGKPKILGGGGLDLYAVIYTVVYLSIYLSILKNLWANTLQR